MLHGIKGDFLMSTKIKTFIGLTIVAVFLAVLFTAPSRHRAACSSEKICETATEAK